MSLWRKRLFLATSHIATDASDHFNLPLSPLVLLAHTSRYDCQKSSEVAAARLLGQHGVKRPEGELVDMQGGGPALGALYSWVNRRRRRWAPSRLADTRASRCSSASSVTRAARPSSATSYRGWRCRTRSAAVAARCYGILRDRGPPVK